MKRVNRTISTMLLSAGLLFMAIEDIQAQEKPDAWSLRQCIDYARTHNIKVRSSQISEQSGQVDLVQAKAQLFPSLTFSGSQNVGHQRVQQTDGSYDSQTSYSGSYSVNSGLTLYNGGKLTRSIKQQEKRVQALEYDTKMAANDIEIAVTQAYLQILYANESLATNRLTLESSEKQMEQSRAFFKAGSVAISDVAQMESQYSNDRYNVVLAESKLANARLELKQLLELEPEEQLEVIFPEINKSSVMIPIPKLEEVYQSALESMPEMKSSRLSLEDAQLNEKIAVADKWPALSLNASIGTNHNSKSDGSFTKQLNNRLNESIGLSLSIPISQNRQVKSAVEKARLQRKNAELSVLNTRKDLLRTVESLYQDAVSAQNRYIASNNSLIAATHSYALVQAQFEEGMRNIVELLTEKNNYLSATQDLLQAKYEAVLAIKLLNFYQNQPITL